MTDVAPFVTGWCNDQPGHPPALHHLCRHTYTGQRDAIYTCTCECHTGKPVRQVQRRPVAQPEEEAPVRYVERRPVHRVQRRSKLNSE